MSKGYVYKWVDSTNGMWYIGSHNGTRADYIGSGVYFKKAYDLIPDKFSREIIYKGNDFRELEEFILEELDAMNDPKSYNLINNWKGGYWTGKKIPRESVRKTQLKRSYKVYCEYNDKTYACTMDAAEDLKCSKSSILNMISGHRPNKYGLRKLK